MYKVLHCTKSYVLVPLTVTYITCGWQMVRLITITKSWTKIFPDYDENKCLDSYEEIILAAKLLSHSCKNVNTEQKTVIWDCLYGFGYIVMTISDIIQQTHSHISVMTKKQLWFLKDKSAAHLILSGIYPSLTQCTRMSYFTNSCYVTSAKMVKIKLSDSIF